MPNTSSINTYYIYRHIRLDTNEVFYIGIGRKKFFYDCYEKEYFRAFSKSDRNKYWNNIVNKTSYNIDILFESMDETEIKQKEIEFIALYGRKDLGTGCLVNMTDGGDGCLNPLNHSRGMLGKKHSIRAINKIIDSNKNRIYSKETKNKISKSLSEYYSNKNNRNNNSLKMKEWYKTHTNPNKGRQLSKPHIESIKKYQKEHTSKEIIQIDLNGVIINKFSSILQASKILKIARSTIHNHLKGGVIKKDYTFILNNA